MKERCQELPADTVPWTSQEDCLLIGLVPVELGGPSPTFRTWQEIADYMRGEARYFTQWLAFIIIVVVVVNK